MSFRPVLAVPRTECVCNANLWVVPPLGCGQFDRNSRIAGGDLKQAAHAIARGHVHVAQTRLRCLKLKLELVFQEVVYIPGRGGRIRSRQPLRSAVWPAGAGPFRSILTSHVHLPLSVGEGGTYSSPPHWKGSGTSRYHSPCGRRFCCQFLDLLSWSGLVVLHISNQGCELFFQALSLSTMNVTLTKIRRSGGRRAEVPWDPGPLFVTGSSFDT